MYFDDRPAWGRYPHALEDRLSWLRCPFSELEYKSRWQKIATHLRDKNLGAMVAFGQPGNCGVVRYLTNFDSYVGNTVVVISSAGDCIIATNSLMRAEPMQSSIWMTRVRDVRVTSPKRYAPTAPELKVLIQEIFQDYGLQNSKIGTVGKFEHGFFDREDASQPIQELEVFDTDFAALSAIKSDEEIAIIRRANAAASDVFSSVRAATKIGVTETHLAGVAFETMMKAGAEGTSFSLALVAGARSGLKHVLPSDYSIQSGDILFIDFGLILDGYVTDNARTGIIGPASDEARRFVETAEGMTQAAISVAGPGVPQHVLDDQAFAIACENGFRDDYYFRAHGVGTTLFQQPYFHPGSADPLRANEVFSLEPMLVRLGYGSACVERTLLVTQTGVEVLDTGPGIWIDD